MGTVIIAASVTILLAAGVAILYFLKRMSADQKIQSTDKVIQDSLDAAKKEAQSVLSKAHAESQDILSKARISIEEGIKEYLSSLYSLPLRNVVAAKR